MGGASWNRTHPGLSIIAFLLIIVPRLWFKTTSGPARREVPSDLLPPPREGPENMNNSSRIHVCFSEICQSPASNYRRSPLDGGRPPKILYNQGTERAPNGETFLFNQRRVNTRGGRRRLLRNHRGKTSGGNRHGNGAVIIVRRSLFLTHKQSCNARFLRTWRRPNSPRLRTGLHQTNPR